MAPMRRFKGHSREGGGVRDSCVWQSILFWCVCVCVCVWTVEAGEGARGIGIR